MGREIIADKRPLKKSENTYDWLGHGFYFWEFNPARARSFAEERAKRKLGATAIEKPFVLGAVIDLGYCWNLLDETGIQVLKQGFETLSDTFEQTGRSLPENEPADEPLKRNLDCAIIETVHKLNESPEKRSFDSIRGVFPEGDLLYPGAGVREKNHIQICVRNPNCIKGFFVPRELDPDYPRPNTG